MGISTHMSQFVQETSRFGLKHYQSGPNIQEALSSKCQWLRLIRNAREHGQIGRDMGKAFVSQLDMIAAGGAGLLEFRLMEILPFFISETSRTRSRHLKRTVSLQRGR